MSAYLREVTESIARGCFDEATEESWNRLGKLEGEVFTESPPAAANRLFFDAVEVFSGGGVWAHAVLGKGWLVSQDFERRYTADKMSNLDVFSFYALIGFITRRIVKVVHFGPWFTRQCESSQFACSRPSDYKKLA